MNAAAFRIRLAAGAAATGFALAIVFLAFPALDTGVSALFYRDGRFALAGPGPAEGVRQLFIWGMWALGIAALSGLAIGAMRRKAFLGLDFAGWLFLIVLLIVGPGLVANSLFKEQWGRPRPRDIVLFGGEKPFIPPLLRTDLCARNCSFIGGEASSIFAVGFGLALLTNRRRAMLAAGILGGLFVGLIRIGQGGHFLSDILFAGVFMAIAAALCHWLVFGVLGRRIAEESPFRERLHRGGRYLAQLPRRLVGHLRTGRDKSLLKD